LTVSRGVGSSPHPTYIYASAFDGINFRKQQLFKALTLKNHYLFKMKTSETLEIAKHSPRAPR
jgi:hypothetical protein